MPEGIISSKRKDLTSKVLTDKGVQLSPIDVVENYKKITDNIEAIIAESGDKTSKYYNTLSEEQITSLRLWAKNYRQEYQILQNDSKALNPTLQLVPQTIENYETMSKAQKDFISSFINGFTVTNWTTDKQFEDMRGQIINFVQSI